MANTSFDVHVEGGGLSSQAMPIADLALAVCNATSTVTKLAIGSDTLLEGPNSLNSLVYPRTFAIRALVIPGAHIIPGARTLWTHDRPIRVDLQG